VFSVVKKLMIMMVTRMIHKRIYFARRRGVTLPEMMVAVAITVAMLLITGMVFKSATDASGQAMAYNEILQQARAVMLQLDQDFRGLRPDMPMAIIFEDTNGVRHDRIVFFADGDYQIQDHGGAEYSGNIARIFYGQSDNYLTIPDAVGPYREILFRRVKLLTTTLVSTWNSLTANLPIQYDYYPVETTTLSYWKNLSFTNYSSVAPFLFTEGSEYSIIRRPDYLNIRNEISNGNIGSDALQAMYLLPDVTEFRVDLWFASPFMQAWFPNTGYVNSFGGLLASMGGNMIQYPTTPLAFYWNVAGAPANPTPAQQYIDGVDWRSDAELQQIANMINFNVWPSALRFTFTLYDKGRRYFPEGATFNYIVKLPPRI
jgi:prepilin-type N-terminal cleavage/methylation domain-containing protein